jgi:glutamine amidotransferase
MHRSLVAAENALGRQSERHPDGWGVAYYVEGAPHLLRSPGLALTDSLFHRVSGVVASETVVAHIRKATQGANTVLNCHPFQHGRWVFAHNGDIPTFARDREALIARIDPDLRRFVLGDTDSEVVFYLVLTKLRAFGPLGENRTAAEVTAALRAGLRVVEEVAPGIEKPNLLTCILTNGRALAAHHGGKELFFSTYKRRCPDRERCAFLAPHCEGLSSTNKINHLVVSSEVLHGENVWQELRAGDVIATDERMVLEHTALERSAA